MKVYVLLEDYMLEGASEIVGVFASATAALAGEQRQEKALWVSYRVEEWDVEGGES